MNLLAVGIPGGVELLVIFVVAVILLGIPLLVILGVASGLSIMGADDEEIDELRARVNDLEAQLADEPTEETAGRDERDADER